MITYLYFKNLMSFGLPIFERGKLSRFMEKFEIGLDSLLYNLEERNMDFVNSSLEIWHEI